MQVRLNHITKSRRRSACSQRDGDLPDGDLLRLVVRSLESIFDAMPAPFVSFDEFVILVWQMIRVSTVSVGFRIEMGGK